jgi:hypothetical protein
VRVRRACFDARVLARSLVVLTWLSLVACGAAPAGGPAGGAGQGGQGGEGGQSGGGGQGGEGGAPVPKTPCEAFCDRVTHRCDDYPQYPGEASCVAVCETWPEGAGHDNESTLACREHHLEETLSDPASHCAHAGPSGGGACGSPCESFCALALALCPEAYDAASPCLPACDLFDDGGVWSSSTSAGDTLQCRFTWVVRAVSDAEACAHVGVESPACL